MSDYNHLGIGGAVTGTVLSSYFDSQLMGFNLRADLQETSPWYYTSHSRGPTFGLSGQWGENSSQYYQANAGYRVAGNLLFFGVEGQLGGKLFTSFNDNEHNKSGFAGYVNIGFTLFDLVSDDTRRIPTIILGADFGLGAAFDEDGGHLYASIIPNVVLRWNFPISR